MRVRGSVPFVSLVLSLLATACGSGSGGTDTGSSLGDLDSGIGDVPNDPGVGDPTKMEEIFQGCIDDDLGLTDPSPDNTDQDADPLDGSADPDPGVDTCQCVTDQDCEALLDPPPPCQRSACVQPEYVCVYEAVEDGSPCDDCDPCTVGDACNAGLCQPGQQAQDCNDGNVCTDDVCIAGVGCTTTPNNLSCDDGNPCTLGDQCAFGKCLPGTGTPVCHDENPCTDDECIDGAGCVFIPNTEPCQDSNECTVDDYCWDGACHPGSEICDCEEDGDCPQDGDLCNGVLVCDKDVFPYRCVIDPGTVVACTQPTDPCLHAQCNPATGLCKDLPVEDGIPCDDGDPCTSGDLCLAGACSPGVPICQCKANADCVPLEDGNLCNGTLVCDLEQWPYQCVTDPPTVVTCPVLPDPCLESTCNPASGQCEDLPVTDGVPCEDGDPCTGGDQCEGGMCQPGTQDLCQCPDDMVNVSDVFCIDRYEASRPDATDTSFGVDGSKATSRPGVLPWFPVDYSIAKAACEATAKRLCTLDEVYKVCAGPQVLEYSYGNQYVADTCNGIDAFCDCDSPNCTGLEECPYPHCRSYSPEGVYGQGCGAAFHVVSTGTFPACMDAYGAMDIVGNVWELVDTGTTESWYKGGAYNCGNSETLHKCNGLYQNISAKGFRCCQDKD